MNGHMSPLPLLLACAAVVATVAGWGALRTWSQSSEAEAVARAITGGDPTRAPAQITRYGCAGCHTIPGIPGADGQVGGSLGNIRKHVFIAGVLPNTAGNLVNWIVQPQAYSVHTAMPVTGISPGEARDAAAWLYAH